MALSDDLQAIGLKLETIEASNSGLVNFMPVFQGGEVYYRIAVNHQNGSQVTEYNNINDTLDYLDDIIATL